MAEPITSALAADITGRIARELASHIRGGAWRETELQDAVEHVLCGYRPAWDNHREFPLDAARRDRPDFVVAEPATMDVGRVGALPLRHMVAVECKIDGGLSALLRQIDRYLAHERVIGCVVVTTRMMLMRLPATLRDKPVAGCLIRGGL